MSISDASIKRQCPFSPSLWGFVSRPSDECPGKCLLITLARWWAWTLCGSTSLTRTKYAVGFLLSVSITVAYFVKVNFHSFLALMGRFLYQFNSCVLSAIKAILSANASPACVLSLHFMLTPVFRWSCTDSAGSALSLPFGGRRQQGLDRQPSPPSRLRETISSSSPQELSGLQTKSDGGTNPVAHWLRLRASNTKNKFN